MVACPCVLVGMNLRDGHRYPPPPLHRIFFIYIYNIYIKITFLFTKTIQ